MFASLIIALAHINVNTQGPFTGLRKGGDMLNKSSLVQRVDQISEWLKTI